MGQRQSHALISKNIDDKPFAAELARIDREAAQNPLVIYTKPGDPLSEKAKKMLDQEGLCYREQNLDKLNKDSIERMKATVPEAAQGTPWLFICGSFVGNYKDIEKAYKEKTLMNIVEDCRDDYNKFYHIE